MKKTILFLSVLLISAAKAQWTLEKLLVEAENRNLNFKISKNNLRLSKTNILQSEGTFFPSFNAGAAHSYNFGKTIDRFTNTFANRNVLSQNFFISSNWVLFNGFARFYQLKASRYSYLAEEANYRNALLELRVNVSTAYLNTLLARENIRIIQSQLALTEFQAERMKNLVEAGVAAKNTLVEILAQLENDKFNLVNAENNLNLQLLNLKQACGLDGEKNFSLAEPDLKSDEMNMEKWLNVSSDELFNKIVLKYPSVQSAEYAVRASEMAWKATMGAKFPVISLNGAVGTGYSGLASEITGVNISGLDTIGITSGGQLVFVPKFDYQTRTKPFFDQYKDNVNKSFGITLTVPLFNNLQNHTAAVQSKIRMENARLSLEVAKQNLLRIVEQNVQQFRSAYARYKASVKNEESAYMSFKMNEERLNNGAGNMQDYLQAKNRYQAAEIQKVQALYEAIFRMKILELMVQAQ